MLAPSQAVWKALATAGFAADHRPLAAAAGQAWDAVVLLADELSHAGDDAEALVAACAAALRPGGVVVASAVGAVRAAAVGLDLGPVAGFTAERLTRALGHRGFTVELLCAPGVAAALGGDPAGSLRLDLDRLPGLVDAGERLLAVARTAADEGDRSGAFFATLPRKVVAAAVLCRDASGRLLVVHDSFKRHWTIPGGVVDPDEDPRGGAEREAWEEAGIRVRAGAVLGVFAGSWPDRVVLVYAAEPTDPAAAGSPAARHAHEIDAAEWLPLGEALERLAPAVRKQVERCLAEPGGTWRQGVGA